MQIHIPTPLRAFTDKQATVSVAAATVAESLAALVAAPLPRQLSSQTADVHVETAIERIELATQYLLRECFTLNHFTGRTHKNLQQRELYIGKLDGLTTLLHGTRGEVEYEILDGNHCRLCVSHRRDAAASNSADAGE